MEQQIFYAALLSILGTLGFLGARTLKKIDQNQTKLFEKMDSVNSRLTQLETEHKLLACKHEAA